MQVAIESEAAKPDQGEGSTVAEIMSAIILGGISESEG